MNAGIVSGKVDTIFFKDVLAVYDLHHKLVVLESQDNQKNLITEGSQL